MAIRQRTYWTDVVPARGAEERAAVALPSRVDLAVVGGGLTGLAAALAAAKRGLRVAVFERHEIGWGASSRNGGMVLTGLKVPVETLVLRFGLERARRLYAASVRSIDHVERLVREESVDCGFRRFGHLELACKPSHYAAFARSAERLDRDFASVVRLVPRSALAAEIASDRYHGALLDERSAGLNPASFVLGLASAARRAGALLLSRTAVEGLSRSDGGDRRFVLNAGGRTIESSAVIVASGAYTDGVAPSLRSRVIPLGSYVIATERLGGEEARALLPRGRMVFDSRHFLHYYRLTPDDRLLFGGRAAFFPETSATVGESAEILRRDMVGVFPQLADAAVDYAWGGTLDFTYDLLPHVGEVDGARFALGYAGHGVAMATYLGSMLGSAAAGDRSDDDDTFEIPLPYAPLHMHFATPWLLPFAGAWFRFLDWVA